MPQPQLCVTVLRSTMADLRRERDAVRGADLVELRLDTVRDLDVRSAVDGRRLPAVVTCRPTWEGGAFDGSEEERQSVLQRALDLGVEYVDVEAAASFADELIRQRAGRGIVLSFHDHTGVPADLAARYAEMRGRRPEIVKMAVAARCLSDLLPLVALADAGRSGETGHVLIGMGPAGVPSRVLAARLRNRWTYAGEGAAPGQLPATSLLDTFMFRRIRADAALYGVVGNPVMHSLSPVMHNAAFAALALNAAYVPLEARDAGDFVEFARRMELRGASITSPFKVALLGYMDEVEALAQRVGAINTVVVRDGRWIGANTDVDGFLAPLAARIRLKGVRATVLGAGGAARAVAVALASQGASVSVSARRPEAAGDVAALVGGRIARFPPAAGSWDVLVNATPAGSAASPINPIEGTDLDGEIVFDLVYTPAETRLLADARAAGCLAIGGLEMLIAQAERQFELWTGMRPPAGLFQSVTDRAGMVNEGGWARRGTGTPTGDIERGPAGQRPPG